MHLGRRDIRGIVLKNVKTCTGVIGAVVVWGLVCA